MEAEYRVLKPEDIPHSLSRMFAVDVLDGFSRKPRRIPPVYLYDGKGNELFEKITDLEEYYIARCEREILVDNRGRIAALIPPEPFNLIELGAGDGRKTVLLIEYFMRKGLEFQYIPLDVSAEAISSLTTSLREKFPVASLKVNGIIAEYFDGLKWLANLKGTRNLVLFLGSNIGNFDYHAMRRFLRRLWDCLKPRDQVLVGFDLKKDIAVLNRAYNDAAGVTREFNLNLLDRINKELGGNFDRNKFAFHSGYNVVTGAVDSFLVSMEEQEVLLGDLEKTFRFDPWEGIHTESSYKFLQSEIRCLAEETGFRVEQEFLDKRGYFADSLWSVEKPGQAGTDTCSMERG